MAGNYKKGQGYWLGKKRPTIGVKVSAKLRGIKRSIKFRRTVSKSNRLRYIKNPLIKISISEKLKGRKLSRRTREKMSISQGGNGVLVSNKRRAQLQRDAYLRQRETIAGRQRPKVCEVCKYGKNIHFDHDHKTGKFRGWICVSCNFILGYARDNPQVLEKLANYLRSTSKVEEYLESQK